MTIKLRLLKNSGVSSPLGEWNTMRGKQRNLQAQHRLKSGLASALILAATVVGVGRASAAEEWPGTTSNFHGFTQYDFKVGELACKVVTPKKVAEGKPWIWRARFFGHEPDPEIELLSRGFHVAYVDVAGLFGSPKAVARWDTFYKYLTDQHGLAEDPALEGMSRGGLIIYNWAIRNPDKVSCIYADAPVCDIKSWPGPYKTYKRRVHDWNDCLKAYGMTKEEAMIYKGNPIDNLQPLAEAKIPLLHVVGAADKTVPVADNTAVIEKRYKELGGEITVISKPNVGHRHGLQDPKPIVDFILKNALPKTDSSRSGQTKPIKVFILAGDECVLEEGVVAAEDKPGTLEKVVAENSDYAFLKDNDGKWMTRDDVFLYEQPTLRNADFIPASEALVRKDWKYMFWPEADLEQLFDLKNDPREENDLAADPKHADKLKEMRKRFRKLKAAAK